MYFWHQISTIFLIYAIVTHVLPILFAWKADTANFSAFRSSVLRFKIINRIIPNCQKTCPVGDHIAEAAEWKEQRVTSVNSADREERTNCAGRHMDPGRSIPQIRWPTYNYSKQYSITTTTTVTTAITLPLRNKIYIWTCSSILICLKYYRDFANRNKNKKHDICDLVFNIQYDASRLCLLQLCLV